MTALTLRAATPVGIPQILHCVHILAAYGKAEHEMPATPEHVQRTLFRDRPQMFGLLCGQGDTAVGFAICSFNYCTWQGQGRHDLYQEDL